MKERTLLVIAGLNSIHIFNIVKYVLIHTGMKITIYNMEGEKGDVNQQYLDFFDAHNIRIVGGGSVAKDGIKNYMKRSYQDIKALGRFDIVNLFFVSHYIAPILYHFRDNYGKIILNFWGSDIFRSNMAKRLSYLPLVKVADTLSFTGERARDALLKHSFFGNCSDRCVIRGMGIPLVSTIGQIRNAPKERRYEWKEKLGIDKTRITIAVGYHGRSAMQQYEAISSILSSTQFATDAVQFLIPSRGMESSNQVAIEKILKEHKATYKMYDEYMDDETMAEFRLLSDIFINAQTTDIGSGSMIEHVCAGSILVNASWLVYPNLDKREIKYFVFQDFSELPKTVNKVLSEYQSIKSLCEQNYGKYANYLSWDAKRESWLKLYEN